MNAEQQAAFEWAKNQNFQSVAARYAKTLADLIESLQAQLAESQRQLRAAVEERDTMMRRHSNQVEVIRQRIDAGWLTCEESWLLSELMFETRYDRRGPQEAEEGERDG